MRARDAVSTVCVAAALVCGCGKSEVRVERVVGGDPDAGAVALSEYGCGTCHAIAGIRGADARVAPPLIDFARQAYVAGVLPNHAEALVRWIKNPREINPGTAMPDLGVTDVDARNMVAYLYQ